MISPNTHDTGRKALKNSVHVWHIVPESVRDRSTLQRCRNILDDREQRQLERFVSPVDNHRYLVSHAMVRNLLSRYAGIAPKDWLFSRNRHGRPEIVNSDVHGLRFNLTHTGGLAACIVTLDDDCGIDAERITARKRLPGVARRMFSSREFEQLKQRNGDEFLDYFYSRWTLREAYVKALGIGISFPTRHLRFEGDSDQIIFIPDTQTDVRPENWHFQLLRPGDEHVVAVALRRTANDNKRIISRPFTFR